MGLSKLVARGSARIPRNTVVSNKSGSTMVAHREYLDSLPSPCPIYSFELNPGLSDTFTWLSAMSRLYETYRMVSCVVEFIPYTSMTTAGQIHMAVDYDCMDDDPSSVSIMSNYTSYKSGSVREPLKLVLTPREMNRSMPAHYIRHASVADSDKKTYDFGKLILSVEGDTLAHVGTVMISYSVQFHQPTLGPIGDTSSSRVHVFPETIHVIQSVAQKIMPFARSTLKDVGFGSFLEAPRDQDVATVRVWNSNASPPAWMTLFTGENVEGLTWKFLKDFVGNISINTPAGYGIYGSPLMKNGLTVTDPVFLGANFALRRQQDAANTFSQIYGHTRPTDWDRMCSMNPHCTCISPGSFGYEDSLTVINAKAGDELFLYYSGALPETATSPWISVETDEDAQDAAYITIDLGTQPPPRKPLTKEERKFDPSTFFTYDPTITDRSKTVSSSSSSSSSTPSSDKLSSKAQARQLIFEEVMEQMTASARAQQSMSSPSKTV